MASKSPSVAQAHAAIACLGRLTGAFGRRRQQLAESVGLSEGQWSVLEEIATQHFMPSMFAKTRASSPAAVSKTLRQLKGKGLTSVGLSPADGRQRAYLLTAKGKRVLDVLRKERELAIEEIWLPLDASQLQLFVTFGNQLCDRLERYDNQDTATEKDK
jgi:DNA-binding MarR family transcriptional regulator